MKYPDACLSLGLLVAILRMSHEWHDFPPVLQSGGELYQRDVAFGTSDS